VLCSIDIIFQSSIVLAASLEPTFEGIILV